MENEPKIALVVGGTRGIGRAVALRLAKAGFDLWLTYRSNNEAAEQMQAEVRELRRSCDLLRFDVADHVATQAALADRANAAAPYAVVFNAGIVCLGAITGLAFFKEKMGGWNIFGLGLALAAIILIALGNG